MFAITPNQRANELAKETHAAIISPLDYTAIRMSGQVLPRSSADGARRIKLKVEPGDLHFRDDNEELSGSMDFVLVKESEDQDRKVVDERSFEIKASRVEREKLQQSGIIADDDVVLDRKTAAVRVIAVDRTTGEIGSVTVPVSQ